MPLVSTYKKREVIAPEPLPPDWSEHTAPTGRKTPDGTLEQILLRQCVGQTYYFNATTQQSTYTRPTAANTFALANPTSNYPYNQQPPTSAGPAQSQSGNYISLSDFAGPPQNNAIDDTPAHDGQQISRQQFNTRRRNEAFDRPKHKTKIPNCEPWLLVRTKLGRRFAHNPDTDESFWRMPKDVWLAVKAMDLKEKRKRERRERGEASESEPEVEAQRDEAEAGAGKIVPVVAEEDQQDATDSDEYTEVTDSEGEEGAEDGDEAATTSKRQRTSESETHDDGPVEFDEDDMAYQLQMMEEMQNEAEDDDQGDEDMADAEENVEEDLSAEDAAQLFKDLLDDHNINPYSPFEKLIEEGSTVIQDDRWTALPTMKFRREVWDSWTRESIAALQERKKLLPSVDPKIGYLEFLSQYATPKLYWPEFKRKYRKEAAMKDTKVSEKDKEKLFRDHIKRLQLSTSTQKSDLTALLKSAPLSQLNNTSSCRNLPASILTDLRYITLPPKLRDPLIETYISTLPGPPSEASTAIAGEVEAIAAKAKDRKRREDALKERSRKVEEEKRRNERDLRDGRRTLQEEEMEIQRAMKVGKDGLRGHLRE